MVKNLNFKSKVNLLVLVLILFAAIVGVGYHLLSNKVRDIGIEQAGETMLTGYKNELKDIVQVMGQALSSATKGMRDEQAIHDTFSTLIESVRFFPDQSGYYFIYKLGGEVFVHAAKPELEGRNLFDLKDADGTLLIQELEKEALKGGGYVNYLWEKPGRGIQPKLSYTQMVPGQPYWIGTGVYIDDVEAKEASIFKSISAYTSGFLFNLYAILALVFLLGILPLAYFIIKSMIDPLNQLTEAANQYSLGELDMELVSLDRKDEVGELAQAMKRLGASTNLLMRKLIEARNRE